MTPMSRIKTLYWRSVFALVFVVSAAVAGFLRPAMASWTQASLYGLLVGAVLLGLAFLIDDFLFWWGARLLAAIKRQRP